MKKLETLYNLPTEVIFCKKCVISNQRPRIHFNEQGICSACLNSDYNKKINWKWCGFNKLYWFGY